MSDIFLKSGDIRYSSFSIDDENEIDCERTKIANIVAGESAENSSLVGGVFIDEKQGVYKLNGDRFDGFMMLYPTPDPCLLEKNQRDVLLISAPSGSGKSTWASRYAEAFQKTNTLSRDGKQPRVIIFSAVPTDPEFDDRINIRRIPFDLLLDEKDEPNDLLKIDELIDSLVIFDDVDVIHNKKLKTWVTNLRNQCLEIGRHYNISLICTNHQIMAYNATKILLMECNKVVLFPRSGAKLQIKRYLLSYGGLSPKQVDDVFRLKTQWFMLSLSYPRYIMYANGCYFLDCDN